MSTEFNEAKIKRTQAGTAGGGQFASQEKTASTAEFPGVVPDSVRQTKVPKSVLRVVLSRSREDTDFIERIDGRLWWTNRVVMAPVDASIPADYAEHLEDQMHQDQSFAHMYLAGTRLDASKGADGRALSSLMTSLAPGAKSSPLEADGSMKDAAIEIDLAGLNLSTPTKHPDSSIHLAALDDDRQVRIDSQQLATGLGGLCASDFTETRAYMLPNVEGLLIRPVVLMRNGEFAGAVMPMRPAEA